MNFAHAKQIFYLPLSGMHEYKRQNLKASDFKELKRY